MRLFIDTYKEGDKFWNLKFNEPEMKINPEEIKVAIKESYGNDIVGLDKLIIAYRIVRHLQGSVKAMEELDK